MTDRGGAASLLPYTPAGVTGIDDDDELRCGKKSKRRSWLKTLWSGRCASIGQYCGQTSGEMERMQKC